MSTKNHKMVDGKLLQTDKKYNALKMKQKEKIALWLNEEITIYYRNHGAWPTREHEYKQVLEKLYDRINAAEIWIPYGEICKHFLGKRNSRIGKVQSALAKQERSDKDVSASESTPLTVNLYYTGVNGSARAFVEEMASSGLVEKIRAEEGNLRYEYFFPMDDPETVLLIDKWADEHALSVHHKSPMMDEIKKLRDKYEITLRVERYSDRE